MKRWVIGAIGIATALALSSACDSTATISYKNIKVETLQVVSAVPLVEEDGLTTRACQVGPTQDVVGLDLALTVKGTAFDDKQTCGGKVDQDQAVRPGDRLERVMVVPGDNFSPEAFSLDVACVEPYPDADDAVCQGVPNVNVDPASLIWAPNHREVATFAENPVRCEPAAVALLVDQSGSMAGFVNAALKYQEDVQGDFLWPTDRQQRASDPHRHRITAVQDFIAKLNANDKLVVFSFQEKDENPNFKVLCTGGAAPATGELAEKPEYFRQAYNCFGTNRAVIEEAVALAYGDEEGRTPLWSAVQKAYEFLQDDIVDAPDNRHIVVIGDGPDTCNVDSDEFLTGKPQCSNESYQDVRDFIIENNNLPGAHPVHVHFVQIQAWGYPERDPRQQELACLTGGHHLFVDGFDMARSAGTVELAESLKEAIARIRYSLSGNWHMRVETPVFQVPETEVGYLAPGFLYGVSGTLTLEKGDFTGQAVVQPFDASGGMLTGQWDQRVSFRRMCDTDAQCANVDVGDPEGPCMDIVAVCSQQKGTCSGQQVPKEDDVACTTNAITGGQCFAGTCHRPCSEDADCPCQWECEIGDGVCVTLPGTGTRGQDADCTDLQGQSGTCDSSDNCVDAG